MVVGMPIVFILEFFLQIVNIFNPKCYVPYYLVSVYKLTIKKIEYQYSPSWRGVGVGLSKNSFNFSLNKRLYGQTLFNNS